MLADSERSLCQPSGIGSEARVVMDVADFDLLFAGSWLTMVRLSALLLGVRQEAEDVVQETYTQLFQRWGSMRDLAGAIAYLRVCVINGSGSALRRRRVAQSPRLWWRGSDSPPADVGLLAAEEHRDVLRALAELPHRQREVLVLRYWPSCPRQTLQAASASRVALSSHPLRAALPRSAGSGRPLMNDPECRLRAALVDTASRVTSAPPALGEVKAGAMPSSRGRRAGGAWSLVIATAVVVTFVAVASTWVVARSRHASTGNRTAADGRAVASPPSLTPSPPGPVHASGPRPAACSATQLAPSVVGGPAAGTENVTILLRNVSSEPCWLGGIPTIAGITGAGARTALPFRPTRDPGQSLQMKPGSVLPGRLGAVHLSLGLNNCPGSVRQYAKLSLTSDSRLIAELPYPPELRAPLACIGDVGQLGLPDTSPYVGCAGTVTVRPTGRPPQQLSSLLPLSVVMRAGDVIEVGASGSCAAGVRGLARDGILRSSDGRRYVAARPGAARIVIAHRENCVGGKPGCQLNPPEQLDGLVDVTVAAK